MKRRSSILLLATTTTAVVAASSSSSSVGGVESTTATHLRTAKNHQPRHHHQHHQHQHANQQQQSRSRSLVSAAYCGTNWQDAHDTCNTPCEAGNDEECGAGRYCFTYMECTPSTTDNSTAAATTTTNITTTSTDIDSSAATAGGVADEDLDMQLLSASSSSSSSSSSPAPAPTATMANIPSYIASLPVAPSTPTTPAPFLLTPPTPNTLPNPNSNYCGYDWESANSECFHACPSGLDDECPSGRKCHTWLKCTQAAEDPAIYSVCGSSWEHAASTCATRCFQGSDDSCPTGESCFRGVIECADKLPTLTAVDAGLAEKTFTEEEIALLLDEEIAKERDEEAMSNPDNWWCGTSYSNMLETCSKRCSTDEDCNASSWEAGFCYKTTGGPENCATEGVPVKEPVPEGSRWCGSSWNDMLETCVGMCEADDDCGEGKTCWEAPGTCQWIGVPAKEKSDPATLWCGSDFDDAMTSCHKACPGETNEECPPGMSCFSGSACTTEGEPVVREGYRCGTTWDDASVKCGLECQKNSDCNEEGGEECFADVVCESELKANATDEGMFCGETWESTSLACTQSCEVDDDCPDNQWCYWVECENGTPDEDEMVMMMEPTTEATPTSCDAEVKECPNGVFVAKAPELGCDFYPCPEGEESEIVAAAEGSSSSGTDLSGWGSTPLSFTCTSDGSGSCGLCQGDCSSDDDCQEGLLCFSRGEGEVTSVPGCTSGGADDLPGMDYCYSPFPPSTTTTTTEATTTTTTTAALEETAYTMGNLNFARECTESEPCGVCEGDCDNDMQCGDGLKCFSRVKGSVDLVPGCEGLGIDGMDYCYDPNAPEDVPPPTTTTPEGQPAQAGCSAEVRSCSDGSVVRQDPNNNCEFVPCPEDEITANDASIPDSDTSMPSESTETSPPTEDLAELITDEPTTSPITSPPPAMPSGAATMAMTSGAASCDDLCLEVLPSAYCPTNTEMPNCLEVGLGELCAANGECATDDKLNNCDTFDIYVRVVCGFETPSQGQLMNGTVVETTTPEITSSVTQLPTMPPSMMESLTTNSPTTPSTESSSSAATTASSSSSSSSSSTTLSSVEDSPVVIVDAIAANNDASTTTTTLAQGSVSANTTTTTTTTNTTTTDGGFQYDRGSGAGGGVDNAAAPPHEEPAAQVWYTMTEEGEGDAANANEGWPPADSYEGGDLTAYFQKSAATSIVSSFSAMSMSILLGIIPVILIWQ